MYLSIDGGEPIKIEVEDTGGGFSSKVCEFEFSSGAHEVRLFNPWAKMPDIDKMTIK